MSPRSKRDMLGAVQPRYQKASREVKSRILDEFCATTGYHRKYAIHLLNSPLKEVSELRRRRRGHTYSAQAVRVLADIWQAAGLPMVGAIESHDPAVVALGQKTYQRPHPGD